MNKNVKEFKIIHTSSRPIYLITFIDIKKIISVLLIFLINKSVYEKLSFKKYIYKKISVAKTFMIIIGYVITCIPSLDPLFSSLISTKKVDLNWTGLLFWDAYLYLKFPTQKLGNVYVKEIF